MDKKFSITAVKKGKRRGKMQQPKAKSATNNNNNKLQPHQWKSHQHSFEVRPWRTTWGYNRRSWGAVLDDGNGVEEDIAHVEERARVVDEWGKEEQALTAKQDEEEDPSEVLRDSLGHKLPQ